MAQAGLNTALTPPPPGSVAVAQSTITSTLARRFSGRAVKGQLLKVQNEAVPDLRATYRCRQPPARQ